MIDSFIKLCQKLFLYLEKDFDFRVTAIKRDKFGAHIVYINKTTGIRILFERREGFVFITLYRLINGDLPVYKNISEYDNDFSNRFGLDDLIILRSPSSYIEQKYKKDFNIYDLEEILLYYSKALNAFGKDILQGDFDIFSELSKIVIKRIEEYRNKNKN